MERKRHELIRSRSAPEVDDEAAAVARPDPEECSVSDRSYSSSNRRRSLQNPSPGGGGPGAPMPGYEPVHNGVVSRRHSTESHKWSTAGRHRSPAPRLSRQLTHPAHHPDHVQQEAQVREGGTSIVGFSDSITTLILNPTFIESCAY